MSPETEGRMTKTDNHLAVVRLEKKEEGEGREERRNKNPQNLLILLGLIWEPGQTCFAAFKSLTIFLSETDLQKERTPQVPHDSSVME